MRPSGKTLVLLFTILAVGTVAFAGDRYPAKMEYEKQELVLNGYGLCEYGFFEINLYWCALYLEKKSRDAEQIIESKQVKRIQLDFIRALTAEQLRKAYTASFKVNAGKDLPKYQQGLDQLRRMLVSVKKGDSLAFTYVPDKSSTVVTLNSKELGTIEGEEWGEMFVRLYLGPKPPDKDMRKAMLGRR